MYRRLIATACFMFIFWPWILVLADLGCWILTNDSCSLVGWMENEGRKVFAAAAWSVLVGCFVAIINVLRSLDREGML